MTIRAQVTNEYCATHVANPFSKSIAVNYEMLDAQQASLGHLGMADRMASHIHQINQQIKINAVDVNFIKLNNIKQAAPSVTGQYTLSAIDAATGLGSQYVLSGVVKQLGMQNEDAYARAWDGLLKSKINKQQRMRHFRT